MKIFDSHIHIFNERIISNVSQKTEMVRKLDLQTDGAEDRLDIMDLEGEMQASGVNKALMLSTASAEDVEKVNRDNIKMAARSPRLLIAGTLHPDYPNLKEELTYLRENSVRAIKLCSFSQGFSLYSPQTRRMFDFIQEANQGSDAPFVVVLDTFYLADRYFGTLSEHNTTPKGFGDLVKRYHNISFIGAHMGGLCAPFDEICRYLVPRSNFYLDTSNAAHTLNEREFIRLLAIHGPQHILFGTDWPWFSQGDEIKRIDRLLGLAGFGEREKGDVFSGNLSALLRV